MIDVEHWLNGCYVIQEIDLAMVQHLLCMMSFYKSLEALPHCQTQAEQNSDCLLICRRTHFE